MTQAVGFLQLVADPQRWDLLRELGRSDRTVGELVNLVGKPQNLVSYHLGELRKGGLVSSRRSSADGRDTYYRANLPEFRTNLAAAGSALHPGLRLGAAAAPVWRRGRKPRVLFLCTGNSSRSQMAEAILRQASDGAVEAKSAGSDPKPLHPNAVRVMAERGLDIHTQKSKHLDRFTHTRFDRVITLCDKVREICPEFPGVDDDVHWSLADPATEGATDEASYPAFVRTADELEWRVDLLLTELSSKEASHAR